MTIGLPEAYLFHRYGVLWRAFFEGLGCAVATSGATTAAMARVGASDAMDECCLPAKIYLGHVRALIGRCDAVLVPRFDDFGRDALMCVRFLGLYDVVRNTYRDLRLLDYNISRSAHQGEQAAFVRMGRALGAGTLASLRAYRQAEAAQRVADQAERDAQAQLMGDARIKVLVTAQPYILRDPILGGPICGMIEGAGGVALLSDRFDREACLRASRTISRDLYWALNREAVGAVALNREHVDGVILLTAFPCGGDALANELTLRRIRDVPMVQIVLDELSGDAGLATRIESFMDILSERRRPVVRTAGH